ncbi:MAG: DUF1488 family protein [Janthinobacterium lividum]
MPLQPIDVSPRDEGHFFSFAMRSETRMVRCHVQQGALDSIEKTASGDAKDRMDRFRRHRSAFEAVASDLFDAGLPVRITADHMTWLRTCAHSTGVAGLKHTG